MGLSTVYANVVMAVLFLTALSVLVAVYSDGMGESAREAKMQADRLADRVDTGIRISEVSTTTSDSFVRVYVQNTGSTSLRTDCVDFYIDREYVNPSDMAELVLANATFDPGLWNPGETLKMRVTYGGQGQWNEAKAVTCNGVSASALFFGAG